MNKRFISMLVLAFFALCVSGGAFLKTKASRRPADKPTVADPQSVKTKDVRSTREIKELVRNSLWENESFFASRQFPQDYEKMLFDGQYEEVERQARAKLNELMVGGGSLRFDDGGEIGDYLKLLALAAELEGRKNVLDVIGIHSMLYSFTSRQYQWACIRCCGFSGTMGGEKEPRDRANVRPGAMNLALLQSLDEIAHDADLYKSVDAALAHIKGKGLAQDGNFYFDKEIENAYKETFRLRDECCRILRPDFHYSAGSTRLDDCDSYFAKSRQLFHEFAIEFEKLRQESIANNYGSYDQLAELMHKIEDLPY